jgi:hypothetical protein
MNTTKETNNNNSTAIVKTQSKQHFAKPLKGTLNHGLFFDPRRTSLDGRYRVARIIRNLEKHLLEPFKEPYPAGVLLIVQRCAFKALRCKSFETYVLNHKTSGSPPESSDDKYIKFAGSLTKDVELLHRMAQETPANPLKTLEEYLAGVKKAGEIIEQEKAENTGTT